MFQVDRQVAEFEPDDDAAPHREHSPYPSWPPRPATVVAAMFVGSSLFFINFVDIDFAGNLSDLYGWPLSHRHPPANPIPASRALAAATLVADLFISAILLASACVTTQVGACLLVRSPRLTVRVLVFVIAATAMLLAVGRWKQNFLTYFLYTGFYYSVASLIVLVVSVLFRLELPTVEASESAE